MYLGADLTGASYRLRVSDSPAPPPTPKARMTAMGDTIRYFRERAGANGGKLTVTAAARKLNQSRQSWEAYEKGAHVTLRDDKQAEIAGALSIPPQILRHEYERRLGIRPDSGVAEEAKAFSAFPELSAPRLLMPDDCLRPWATSATTILYDPNLPPIAGEGCVIRDATGFLHVKIFQRADAEKLYVGEIFPAPRELTFDRGASKAYRVIGRLG